MESPPAVDPLIFDRLKRAPDCKFYNVHTGKSFRNIIKPNRNQIVLTIFRLIWIQTDVRLDPNRDNEGLMDILLCLIRCYFKIQMFIADNI